jgi:uncharacterized protein with von Willebrand factor type A (vWA) domain
MTEQPEAERLADALEAWTLGKPTHHREAAAELRRLHAANADLLEALKAMLENGQDYTATRDKARAAIARAEGEQP